MSDRTKNDLHKTGCRRYRDINKVASPGTAAGADLNFCTPRGGWGHDRPDRRHC